jgi:predicted nucleotidyltransferase
MHGLPELARRLQEALSRQEGVRFAFLYGSSVTRGPDRARDVDVAVAFSGQPSLLDVAELALDLERAAGKTVDLVDLDDASTLLRWEVVRTGRVLLGPDASGVRDFLARVPIESADLCPYLEREAEGLRRALGIS